MYALFQAYKFRFTASAELSIMNFKAPVVTKLLQCKVYLTYLLESKLILLRAFFFEFYI